MTKTAVVPIATSTTVAVYEPNPDDQLVGMWLHGRSPHTQRGYRREIERFRAYVGKPLAAVTLGDVQSFADRLAHLAPASRARALVAVKSLLSFGHRLGVLPVDVGKPVRLPALKDQLAERIISEADVQRILALEPNRRNAVLVRLLYAGGLRVSEACGLRWRDLQPRQEGGQVTIFGKGAKTRVILLPASVWKTLEELRAATTTVDTDTPVFTSRKGGPLTTRQVQRLVKAAARRAGVDESVSPHFFRHAHASHALDRGAPIHLVQATLGHASVATTGRYLHARPTESSSRYLAV